MNIIKVFFTFKENNDCKCIQDKLQVHMVREQQKRGKSQS